MVPIIAVCVGIVFFIGGTYWLWYMLARPEERARLTEKDHDFWVCRGLPIKWTGAAKEFEQGRGLKALVVFCTTDGQRTFDSLAKIECKRLKYRDS